MKYYKDTEGNLYADPVSTDGLEEVLSPVRADGTILPQHDAIGSLALQEDGSRYSTYLTEPEEDGVYQPDLVAIGEATMIATAQEAVSYITAMVQARIDQYNKDHNLAFTGIEGMAKYTRRTKYSHYQFVNDVLDWNEDVWEEANLIKARILSGEIPQPTAEEFAVMLPEYTGVI